MPDGSVIHWGQVVRGIERLSFTTQQLTEPLQLIPEEGSPQRDMGDYWQDADGTEVLVADVNQVLGTMGSSDRQVHVVDPSGRLTEIGYRLVDDEDLHHGADHLDWLVDLGREINRLVEAGR